MNKRYPQLVDPETASKMENGDWMATVDYGPQEGSSKQIKQTIITDDEKTIYQANTDWNLQIDVMDQKPYQQLVNSVFPEFTTEETMKRIRSMWDLSGPVPLPKFEIHCPVCDNNQILMRAALFHTRRKVSENPFRCDVKFKCCTCSYVWSHGIVVPKEMATQHDLNRNIHFRELKRAINNHLQTLQKQ
jgi:hypothetical protein